MVAGSASVKARQVVAGLLVLALLALSFGQAVAAPGLSSSDSHRTHHGIQAGVTAVTTTSGDFGSPCEHHGCTHCLTCCIAGGCPMLSGRLPVAVSAPVPVVSAARARPDAARQAPEGLGPTPTLPPPRRIV
jgi:hypothetical protein